MVLPVPPHVYRLVRPCEGGIRHSEATNVSRDSQQWQSLYFFHDRYTFKKSLILIYEDLGAATFKVFPCLACMLPRHCCNRPCTTNQDLFFFFVFFLHLFLPLSQSALLKLEKKPQYPAYLTLISVLHGATFCLLSSYISRNGKCTKLYNMVRQHRAGTSSNETSGTWHSLESRHKDSAITLA